MDECCSPAAPVRNSCPAALAGSNTPLDLSSYFIISDVSSRINTLALILVVIVFVFTANLNVGLRYDRNSPLRLSSFHIGACMSPYGGSELLTVAWPVFMCTDSRTNGQYSYSNYNYKCGRGLSIVYIAANYFNKKPLC